MLHRQSDARSPLDLHALIDQITLEEQVGPALGRGFLVPAGHTALSNRTAAYFRWAERGTWRWLVGGVTAAVFPVGISRSRETKAKFKAPL